MAILIKGMEMPKHDDEYVIFTVYGDGGVVYGPLNRHHVRYKNRAVPVPPHGRLVDADEMYEEFVLEGQRSTRYKLGEAWELNGKEIRRAIYRLPTVIPASEEG